MKNVYLAGQITGHSYDESTNWRNYVIKKLAQHKINGISPMRRKEYLHGINNIPAMGVSNNPLSTPKGITTRDRYDCTNADALLVYLLDSRKVSIGTMIELGWADAHRVPIVIVMEPSNMHNHAMVNEVAGFIVPTLEEGIALVVAILEPYTR
jgi:nucleoside 2-deoxyribosyltransferase